MYADGDYDLAGFCVGAVERGQALTGNKVEVGDVLLGLASSGVHIPTAIRWCAASPPTRAGSSIAPRCSIRIRSSSTR
jgi:hypothetical protein